MKSSDICNYSKSEKNESWKDQQLHFPQLWELAVGITQKPVYPWVNFVN
jgi:hypothetical protein